MSKLLNPLKVHTGRIYEINIGQVNYKIPENVHPESK